MKKITAILLALLVLLATLTACGPKSATSGNAYTTSGNAVYSATSGNAVYSATSGNAFYSATSGNAAHGPMHYPTSGNAR